MPRQRVEYEWSIFEEEWERRRLTTGVAENVPVTAAETTQGLWGQVLRTLVVALATVTLTGATFTPPAKERSWAETAITPTLHLEAQAWATRDEPLLTSLIDPQAPARFQDEWRFGWNLDDVEASAYRATLLGVEPVGNLIKVQLSVTQPTPQWWLSSPHRETRFYRQTGTGWVRTLPDDDFWGEQRAIETTHLRFEFRDRDMATVIPVVDQVEQAYVQAHAWLNMSLPASSEKTTIVIAPDLVRGWGGSGTRQQMTSPSLAKVPVDLSDADYLTQQVVGRLASRTLNRLYQDYERSTNTYQWRTMLWALGGWFRTELVGQRTPWHLQAEALFAAEIPDELPLRLHEIENRYPSWRIDQASMMVEYMIAETVVDYVITTHGRQVLPDLVLNLNDNHSWATVVPAIFDQTAAEFEADWNEYLRKRLALSKAND